jgi:cell division protein FtsA
MQSLKAIFDIGNWYVKWALISQEEWKHIVLVKDMVKTKGMRKGKVLDSNECLDSIKQVMQTFFKKLGADFVDEVHLTISHPDMVVTRFNEQKRIMSDKIINDDIDHLLKIVWEIAQQPNYEIIKLMPVNWIVDETMAVSDPIGMEARRLELVSDVFAIPKSFYTSLVELFDKMTLNITDITPNILVASELLLDFDQKDLWTLLIDIWYNQTSYVVYENGYPLIYWVIPMWWEDVTKDISIGLQVDIKEAEKIKVETWLSTDTTGTTDDRLDLTFLNNVITSRYEEIFELINNKLIDIDKDWRLAWWVYLYGGWAKLTGSDEIAKNMFKLATFYAKDHQMWLPELGNHLQLINLLWAYHWSEKYHQDNKRWSWLWFSMDWAKNVWNFIKEIF